MAGKNKTPKNLSAELAEDPELTAAFGGQAAAEEELEEELEGEELEGEEEGSEEEGEEEGSEEEGEEEGEAAPRADGQQERQPKMVPHAALHEARERVKALQDANTRAMARMNALMAAQRPASSFDRSSLPDLEQDPLGYIRGLETMLEQREQRDQEAVMTRQVDQGIELDEQTFQTIYPDYPDASEFYVQSRAAELGRFHRPEAIAQMLYNEVRQIARLSWQSGKSTAQTVYELAQQRGYAPKQTEQQGQQRPQGQQGQGSGGQGAGAAPRALKQPQQGARLATIAKGQRNSRSMGGSGGSGSAAELNAEALLDMSDAEFEEYLGLGTKGANERFAAIAGR